MTPVKGHGLDMRWRDYVHLRGPQFDQFWAQHANESGRKLLFVVGRGFDPRTAVTLKRIAELAPNCPIDVLGLEFDHRESASNAAQIAAAATNWHELQAIANKRGQISSTTVKSRSEDDHRILARSAANIFNAESMLSPYSDMVVDISAMPRGVYFPLIARLLHFHDTLHNSEQAAPNIHVVVSEDPHLDTTIREQEIDESASFLHPFEGSFNREAKGDYPTVWIPVLGEGRTTQFDRIYDLVKPIEVCPVLPSPSRNPRRGDNIVMEYRDLLFEQLRVDPRNVIYASEFNPFEVYRQIRETTLHYHEVLGLIGGCKVALSALCSKLMSLGVLLVAYELKASNAWNVGIAHIDCESYSMPDKPSMAIEHVGLWIAGECYAE